MPKLSNIERSFDEIKKKPRVSTPNPWLDRGFNRIDPWGKEPGIRIDDIPERLGLSQKGETLDLMGNYFVDLGDTPSNYGEKDQFVKTDGSGKLTFDWPYWVKAGSTIYYKKGNVGVGLSAPLVRFHTFGDNILDGAVTINESGRDKDFRVEGDSEVNLLFCDASTDRVAFGLNAPVCRVHIRGVACADYAGLSTDVVLLLENDDNVRLHMQAATDGTAYIDFCDNDYNPPAGRLAYDFANNWLEFGVGTNEILRLKAGPTFEYSTDTLTLDGLVNVSGAFLGLTHVNAYLYFSGGTGSKGIAYKDTGNTLRPAIRFPSGSDVVTIINHASNGTVEIHANTSTAGLTGDVKVAEFQDNIINLSVDLAIRSNKELRFYDNGNYVGFEAPALAADQIWVLPDADAPAANQCLMSDGAGSLGWSQALGTTDSPTFVTAKLTALTDGYVPYHIDDATGLANSPIFTDGTLVGIGKAPEPGIKFHVYDSANVILEIESGSDNATLFINSGTDGLGAEESTIKLLDNSVVKWQIYKPPGNNFAIYDNVGTRTVMTVPSSGDMTLMPTAGNVGIGQNVFGANAEAVLALGTDTAPTTSPANCFQMYSADIGGVAGKAGAHFRDEEGNVVSIGSGGVLMTGTARVIKKIYLNNAAFTKGTTAPTQGILGNLNDWKFDIGDDAVMTRMLPTDWAVGTDLTIKVCWYIDEAYAADKEVQWRVDWSALPHDFSEAVDAPTHSGQEDSGDIDIPAVAKRMGTSTIGTIAGASLSVEDMLGFTLSRIDVTHDDPTLDPGVHHLVIEYTADKLGEAIS